MINITILPATNEELKTSSTHTLFGTSCTGFHSVLTDKRTEMSYHFDFPEEVYHCTRNNFIDTEATFELGTVSCGSNGQGLNPNNFATVYIKNVDYDIPLKF